MGTIKKCLYHQISKEECSVERAARFYYHHNLMTASDSFMEEYESYEREQTSLKNRLLKMHKPEGISLRAEKSMLAISSISDSVVLYAEL